VGGQRSQGRAVDRLEQLEAAAGQLLEGPRVEPGDPLADGGVGLGQAEERAPAQGGQHPAGGLEDAGFRFRLVTGLPGASGDDRTAVVGGHLLVRGVEVGLVAVGLGDARTEVVGHDDAGTAADRLEGVDVPPDPVGQRLGGEGLGIRVARGAQDGHEQLRPPHLAGGGIDDGQGLAGEVDEELLAGAVLLAHDQVEPPLPGPVEAAELGVPVAVGVLRLVLHVQQLEGHALAAQLAVDGRPVGQRPARGGWRLLAGEEAGLELGVVHVRGQGPGEAGPPGAGEVVAHRRGRHPRGGCHLAAAEALAQGEAEDVADLAHGGTGAWHRQRSSNGSSSEARWRTLRPSRQRCDDLTWRWPDTPERLAGFGRNKWPDWSVIRTMAGRSAVP
jgi:hypothetical protein